jgi:hypothetical protein
MKSSRAIGRSNVDCSRRLHCELSPCELRITDYLLMYAQLRYKKKRLKIGGHVNLRKCQYFMPRYVLLIRLWMQNVSS